MTHTTFVPSGETSTFASSSVVSPSESTASTDAATKSSITQSSTTQSSATQSSGTQSLETTSSTTTSSTITSSASTSSISDHTTTTVSATSSDISSSSATTSGPLRAVTNLVQNGNFAFADSHSSNGLFAFEAMNQARRLSDKGYTGDGSQETGCAQLQVPASSTGPSKRELTASDDGISAIQQWLQLPVGSNSLAVQLYYAAVTSDASSSCSLSASFGGNILIVSPFFDLVADVDTPTWLPLAYQATEAPTQGYLRLELVCLGGKSASILLDQVFATTEAALAEFNQIRLVWPVIDGQTQSTLTESTETQSTASRSTVETTSSGETSTVLTIQTASSSASSSLVSASPNSVSSSALRSDSTTSTSTVSAETETTAAGSQISSQIYSPTVTSTSPDISSLATSSSVSATTTALSVSENSSGAPSGHESNTTTSITSGSSIDTSFSTTSTTEMTSSSITTHQSSIDSVTTSDLSSSNSTSSFQSLTTINSTSSAANSTASMTSGSTLTTAVNATSTSSESLWTISVTGTMTPISSASASATTTHGDRPEPTSLDDLSPAAREIYDFVIDHLGIDENGNVNVPAPPQGETELIPSAYDPEDATRQQELADELEAMGMPPLDDLFTSANEKVDAAESGTCPNLDKRNSNFTPLVPKTRAPKRRHEARFLTGAHRLEQRLSKRDFWDVACNDATEAVLGVSDTLGTARQALCLGKSIYDARDAFKCIFGGCGPTILYEDFTYTWHYEWKVLFPSIASALVWTTDGSRKLSCVDCSFNLSSLKFTGTIIVRQASGRIEIREATLIPEVTGAANMIVELKSGSAWTSSWDYIFEAATLDTIRSDKAYTIESKILYNVGVKWSTDKAVNVRGGASFSFKNAKAELNMASNTPSIRSKSGWNPSVSYITPSFQTSGGVTIQPYIRWGVEFKVNIYNQVKIAPVLLSESIVTIKSTFSSESQGTCPANKLAVSTFVTSKNNMRLPGSGLVGLYNGDSASRNNCFDAPDLVPTVDEIRSLASLGGEFCTSYLRYTPAKSTTIETSTVYTPSTTITETTRTTIPITTIKTVTETSSMKVLSTVDSLPVGVTVTAGTAPLTYMKLNRRDAAPTPAPAAGALIARAVPTPAMVNGWDSTKLSYACKQVATGSTTITQLVTSTSASGAATTTATITENINGPLVTTTHTEIWQEYGGIKETPAVLQDFIEAPVVTACAVPAADSGTCFKIKVHGPSWVDGQYMKQWVFGGFVPGNAMEALYFDTYYLTSSGVLVAQDPRSDEMLMVAGHPFAQADGTLRTNPNAIWSVASWRGFMGHEPLLCSKDPDPCSRALYCRTETRDGLSFIPPAYYKGDPSQEQIHFRVHVGPVSGGVPATFTWEPAPCICGGDYEWQYGMDW